MPVTAGQTITDDGEQYDVTLSITGDHAAALLTNLAQAIATNPMAASEFFALGMARPGLGDTAYLLRDRHVQAALAVTLDPDEAKALHSQMDDAALEPARCTRCGDRYAVERGLCAEDNAAEDDRANSWRARLMTEQLCTWESNRPFSPEGSEGCDAPAIPGTDRCGKHQRDEDRWAA